LETTAVTDARVLDALAREMGFEIHCPDVVAIRRELGSLPVTKAMRASVPKHAPGLPGTPKAGEAVLSTWHRLVDLGSLLDGDEILAGTARPGVAVLSKETAAGLGVADGADVTVSTERGQITLPALVTEMPDGVVWLPTNSPGSTVARTLGATSGTVVGISRSTGGSE
jgi:NADH-quinone oxidoreductase subunit G